MREDKENEYEGEAVFSGNKVEGLAVWWAYSEVSNADYELQTI